MRKGDESAENTSSGEEVAPNTKIMRNSRYDEAHELSDSTEDSSVDSDKSGVNISDGGDSSPAFGGDSPPMSEDDDDYEFSLGESQDSEIPGGKDELFGEMAKELAKPDRGDTFESSSESDSEAVQKAPEPAEAKQPLPFKTPCTEEESSSDEEIKDGAEDKELGNKKCRVGYDPQEYADLAVSEEIRSLFEYITRYTPQEVQLESKLKPFIPDYMAAIGELDKFVKIPLPDGETTPGTSVLDEPCLIQSDETVLQMQLKATSKSSGAQAVAVRSIDAPDRAALRIEIQRWIDSAAVVQQSKHQIEVQYKSPMPEIEALMQVWPEEVEKMLDQVVLPHPEMSMTTEEYVRMMCSILDVPVYNQKQGTIHAVHCLLSLFMEFSHNPHFNNG